MGLGRTVAEGRVSRPNGQVEKNVQDARRRLWQRLPGFPDIHALNAWLEEQCITQWGEIQHGNLPGTVAGVHADEAGCLMPLGRHFDGFVEHTRRVSPINLLHRLIDGKEDKIARINAPQGLELRREPKADVERYDALRMKDVRHAS